MTTCPSHSIRVNCWCASRWCCAGRRVFLSAGVEAPLVEADKGRLDTRARQVLSAEGLVISLGNSDYRVLRLLLQHPNRPLSRDFLLNHVFDKDSTPFDRSIDVCVSRLRQQLAPGLIKTVRNEGYMLTSACVTSES